MQRFARIFGFLGILLVTCGVTVGYMIYDWSKTSHTLEEPVVLEFIRGTQLESLAWQLQSKDIIDSAMLFRIWVRLDQSYQKFQAGSYEFSGEIRPIDVIDKIVKGQTYQPIVLKFTIPEGFTMKKVIKRLERLGVGSEKQLTSIVQSERFLRRHKIPGKSAEGFLYPATYHFRKNPSPTEVLSHLVDTFWRKLPEDYEDRCEEKGLSLIEAVTFASLIQLETKFDDEINKVSEVIWRRLKMGSPLGIDAALIYGIKDYDGDIKWVHLKDKTNPYNTRIHKGLPPTPITNPDIKSLMAVLSPTNKGYNYYVVNANSKEGRHHFSRTIKEHNRYVNLLKKSGHGR